MYLFGEATTFLPQFVLVLDISAESFLNVSGARVALKIRPLVPVTGQADITVRTIALISVKDEIIGMELRGINAHQGDRVAMPECNHRIVPVVRGLNQRHQLLRLD